MYHNYDRRSSSSFQNELSIRSESVQRIYNFYANQRFYVNRRYQRKLVWTIEEKKAFIDSILQGFPVPIILLAETDRDHESVYEIIDGMLYLVVGGISISPPLHPRAEATGFSGDSD